MNFFKSILKNQSGVSLPIVIVLTGVALSSIGYVALNLLPKLQDSKKRAETIVDYRIFLGSLNDYVVHGVREKWCFPVLGTSGDLVLSNLLLSNDCASTVPMETKVKFPGNLERILWDPSQTIGTDDTNRTTILGLNKVRLANNETVVKLEHDEVRPPIDAATNFPTLKFRLTEQILTDMLDTHPLFAISKDVKGCIENVDIEIARSILNPPQGDEVKLRITIKVDLQDLKLSCLTVKSVKSVTYYTFYPRRLHTFSLIKYGDLDASKYHEYHSPVYVAGNVLLPASATNKPKSSIFYDTLTLGTYNGGSGDAANIYGGVVKDGPDDYTFEDRGNPYTGKQDNYETMRGFLGGIRLDAVEDKGFVSLFVWDNTNQSNVEDLERCIDENKIKTTPSASSGTLLGYSSYSNTPATGIVRFKLGFTKLNRFKPTIFAPAAGPNPSEKFIVTVPAPPAGTQSIGELQFNADSSNNYSATMGAGASVEIKIDLSKFDITNAKIDAMVATLGLPTTEANYRNVIPASHVFYTGLNQTDDYYDATEDFIEKCKDNDAGPVECLLVGVVSTCASGCNTSKYNDFVATRDALVNKLNNDVKAQIAAGEPQMTFSLEDFPNAGGKTIINQKFFQVHFTPQWHYFYDLVGGIFSAPTLQFTGFNYGPDVLKLQMYLRKDSSIPLKLRRQGDNNDLAFSSSSGWRDTTDNSPINPSSNEPKELVEITCPTGMGLADWDLDMSASSNFAWNYTDSSPGVSVDTSEHVNKGTITFDNVSMIGHRSGNVDTLTVSVADECIVKNNRTHVYGFYVCNLLTIESGRTLPLNMIGTFIVKTIGNTETNQPVNWHSIWSPVARDLVLTELNQTTPTCTPALAIKNMLDVVSDPQIEAQMKACSSQDLITNGPNNFTWTTVDPDIGIAPNFLTMTSEKVKRFQRWIVREDSRKDEIR